MKYLTISGTIASIISLFAFLFQPNGINDKAQFNENIFIIWIILTILFWAYFYFYPSNPISKKIASRLDYSGKYSLSNGKKIDIEEGIFEIDTLSWHTIVNLPPFESPPNIIILKVDKNVEEPKVFDISCDNFKAKIHNSEQAGNWKWRARGKLLKQVEISQ